MAKTKATVRRMPFVAIPQRIGNEKILNRLLRNMPFKFKQIIPEMRRVAVKKWTSNKTLDKKQPIFLENEDLTFDFH